MMTSPSTWHNDVLSFWFEELEPKQWFRTDPDLDAAITARFASLLDELAGRSVASLNASPHETLAAIIVLDQFSRNIYRGEARAFSQDALAAKLAVAAVDAGFDAALEPQQRHFMYMPFMHAEDLEMQERSLELFGSLEDDNTLKFAREHHEIIARFGRYPYRNEVLGRTSTPEELEYLEDANTFGQ